MSEIAAVSPILSLVLPLALAVALLGERRLRSAAGAATALFALGAAALAAQPPGPESLSFLRINGGLLLVGVLVVAAAGAVASLQRAPLERAPLARAGGVVALLLAALTAWRIRAEVGPVLLPALGVAGILAAGGVLLALAGRFVRLDAPSRWLERRLLAPRAADAVGEAATGSLSTIDLALLTPIAIGTLLAVLARHAGLILGGVVLAGAAGQWLAWRRGAWGRLPMTLLLLLPLGPAWWLLARIAGPTGLTLEALRIGPLSPAAQVLLFLPIAVTALGLAGLWPVHARVPGGLLLPVAVALLVRLCGEVFPDGVLHWRALVAPIAVVTIWHAAAVRRAIPAVAAMAVLGATAPVAVGATGAWWLGASGVAIGSLRLAPASSGLAHVLIARAAWVAGAWGAALALAGALRGEVVWTTLAALGCAAALWRLRTESRLQV